MYGRVSFSQLFIRNTAKARATAGCPYWHSSLESIPPCYTISDWSLPPTQKCNKEGHLMLVFHIFERVGRMMHCTGWKPVSHTTQQTPGVEAAVQICNPATVLLLEKAAAHSVMIPCQTDGRPIQIWNKTDLAVAPHLIRTGSRQTETPCNITFLRSPMCELGLLSRAEIGRPVVFPAVLNPFSPVISVPN